MLTNYISGGIPCNQEMKTVAIANISDMQSILSPKDGGKVQLLSPLTDDNSIVMYVFNTLAPSGIKSNDGTKGFWNLYVHTSIKKPFRLIFDHYIPKDTPIDLVVLPIGTTNTYSNSVGLKPNEQIYMLNDTEVKLKVLDVTLFSLDKALYRGSKLEFLPITEK